VFVHCAKNVRVSALLSAYRMVLQGVPSREARADLHAIWEPNRVLEKLGLRLEAHFVQNQRVKGRYRDTLIYALTGAEYWSRPGRLDGKRA
jgi:hypothetical protein